MKSLLAIYLILLFSLNFVCHSESLDHNYCSPTCLTCFKGSCLKCPKGLYSYEQGCFFGCPENTFADNFSSSCKLPQEEPIFIKAYTKSRCLNSCGKTFSDCSCSPLCKKFGECCSDYKYCQLLETNHSTDCEIDNCKYCSHEGKYCLQCEENYYYFNNQCLARCPMNTIPIKKNWFCLKTKCQMIKNCQECNMNGGCLKCLNGFYLHNGQCFEMCPVGFIADRIGSVCKSSREISYHWIFPSKTSCYNNCGNGKISDNCLCNEECLRKGNCCDDYDKYCKKVEDYCQLCERCENNRCLKCKDNTVIYNDECKCSREYIYDKSKDSCVKVLSEGKFLKKDKSINSKYTINKNDFNDYNVQFLAKNQILKSIDLFTPRRNDNNTLNQIMNRYLNGNLTLNFLDNNTNSALTNEEKIVENSNNFDNSSKKNINSNNQLSRVITEGNVIKKINFGQINNKGLFGNDLSNKNEFENLEDSFNFDRQFKSLENHIERNLFGSIFNQSFKVRSPKKNLKIHSPIYRKKGKLTRNNLNKPGLINKNKINMHKIYVKNLPIKRFSTSLNISLNSNAKDNSLETSINPYSNLTKITPLRNNLIEKKVNLIKYDLVSDIKNLNFTLKKLNNSHLTSHFKLNNTHSIQIKNNHLVLLKSSNKTHFNNSPKITKTNKTIQRALIDRDQFFIDSFYYPIRITNKNSENKTVNDNRIDPTNLNDITSSEFNNITVKTKNSSTSLPTFKRIHQNLMLNQSFNILNNEENTINQNYIYQKMMRASENNTINPPHLQKKKENKNNPIILNENSNDIKYIMKVNEIPIIKQHFHNFENNFKKKIAKHKKAFKDNIKSLEQEIIYEKINQFFERKGKMSKNDFKKLFSQIK